MLIMVQNTETMCQLLLLFITERPSVRDVTASSGKKANCSHKLKEVGGKHDSIVGKKVGHEVESPQRVKTD